MSEPRRTWHRVLFWLLFAYFLVTVPVGLFVLERYDSRFMRDWTERQRLIDFEEKTSEAREQLDFDSGTISIAETVAFDWDAHETLEEAQADLRRSFSELLGRRVAYQPEPSFSSFHEEVLESGVRRALGTVPAEPGFDLKVAVLRPSDGERLPAVVLAHGFGGSLLQTAGYGLETYHHDMALGLAEAGFVAVTYDLRGLGSGRTGDWGDPSWGGEVYYDDFVGYTLMRGATPMGVWTFDGLQVADAVARLPGVDGTRMAFAGISHGGQVAMYGAGLAPDRFRAAIAMGSFVSFDDLYTRIHNLTGHAIPGLTDLARMGDLAALVAPRPLLVQWGELERDTRHGSLTAGSEAEFALAQSLYSRFGAPGAVESVVSAEMGHGFDVAAAVEFLDRHLAR